MNRTHFAKPQTQQPALTRGTASFGRCAAMSRADWRHG
jgi:hypothetical protein